MMPTVYLRKDLYDKLVKKGLDASEYVNALVESSIEHEAERLIPKKGLKKNE